MSVKALNWAWSQQTGDPTRKLVLTRLAERANKDWECWPSVKSIASDCEISPRVASRHTRSLTEMGLLTIAERRRDNGGRSSNLYRLTPHVAADTSPTSPVTGQEPSVEPSREPGVRDAVWDTLVALFGEPSNQNERGKRNKAVKLIKESLNGGFVGDAARVSEIHARAGRYSLILPDTLFTDMALANQWGSLTAANVPGSSSGHNPIRAMQERERQEREADEALALPPEESQKKLRELMEQVGVGNDARPGLDLS